jgi:hypothetical protein
MSKYPKKRAVVFIILFLLTITLLGVTVFKIAHKSTEQTAKYLISKDDYVRSHTVQEMILYPWEPTNSQKVLPFNYVVPASPGNTISINTTRNQYEAASFVITTQKSLSGITISVPDLKDAQGNSIPADAVNVRTVKVWYQADDESIVWYTTPGYYLTPELLLKDDTLVKVDYTNKINYLKATVNGVEQYIDISSPTATFPSNAEVRDAATLQPFSMSANENKQLWLTVHVPSGTPAGSYSGNITITAPSETPVIMTFNVTVLPFDLEPAPVDYGLYYNGIVTSDASVPINYYDLKTRAQYASELKNMKEHGVLYPTIYQSNDPRIDTPANIDTALSLRVAAGLPSDKIYIVNLNDIGNATDPAGLTTVANKVKDWRNHTQSYGYKDTYFYGMDEAGENALLSQLPAWQTVHNNGGKLFAASYVKTDLIENAGKILDVGILGSTINSTQAAQWHSYGHKVFLYNQPQVGVENPEIYRKNYGFILWNAGYDGAMDFAYQFKVGPNVWNDYDSGQRVQNMRDHVFAYPTTNGVIDTIEWEGFREGVDDTRFVATLNKKEGDDVSAKTIVSSSLDSGDTMPAARQKIIDRILS